jgi:hypothetical protein
MPETKTQKPTAAVCRYTCIFVIVAVSSAVPEHLNALLQAGNLRPEDSV